MANSRTLYGFGLSKRATANGDYRKALEDFHSFYYLRINQRRQEHLASLGLDLRNKRVWEVSAGIGDHTSFFLDRGCDVTCSEVRPELIEILKHRYPKVPVFDLNLENPSDNFPTSFDVVYCYGVLYHLKTPERALQYIASRSRELLLLETCVSPGSGLSLNPVPEPSDTVSQALSGIGCRPTRRWVLRELQKHFPFVYLPRTQPNHEQFPIDWQTLKNSHNLARSIFVASRYKLESPILTTELVVHQTYH